MWWHRIWWQMKMVMVGSCQFWQWYLRVAWQDNVDNDGNGKQSIQATRETTIMLATCNNPPWCSLLCPWSSRPQCSCYWCWCCLALHASCWWWDGWWQPWYFPQVFSWGQHFLLHLRLQPVLHLWHGVVDILLTAVCLCHLCNVIVADVTLVLLVATFG